MSALVIGMGRTGLSIARHLIRRGVAVVAADSRRQPPCEKEFANLDGVQKILCGEDVFGWRREEFDSFSQVAASPGVAPKKLFASAQKIIGDAALFAKSWRANPLPSKIFAVTGTNGKSTTVALIAAVCRAAGVSCEMAGNIGRPLLDCLESWRTGNAPQVIAAELSSFQLETAESFPSDCATVLNVSPDHLDRHGSLPEYAAIKSRIYQGAKKCAVNLDAAAVAATAIDSADITYSETRAADFCLREGKIFGGGMEIETGLCAAPPQNVLAAVAMLSPLNFSPTIIAAGLQSFSPLPHRREVVENFGGVLFVDDSKSTNVASACFALGQIAGDCVLIAGGDGKGQDFSPLAAACRQKEGAVKKAVLFGRDANLLYKVLQGGGVECEVVSDMRTAVGVAVRFAPAGGSVLLSPACSSLDMYSDYAARGDDFAAACRELRVLQEGRQNA